MPLPLSPSELRGFSGWLVVLLSATLLCVWLYVLVCIATWVWAVWEVDMHGWPLFRRVVAPTVLLIPVILAGWFFAGRRADETTNRAAGHDYSAPLA